MTRKRIFDIHTALYLGGFLAVLLFSVWKSRYGFATLDEGFYLSIPYRLCQGDALFRDEWHLSLMVSPILYPIMKLYLGIFGGTDGIILHFRWIYVAVQSLTALYLYARMRKKSPMGAALGSLLYLLFSPYNIMALSYNTIGMLLFSVICITYVTQERTQPWQYGLYGFLFALAVLCCPFLLIVYVGYGAVFCRKAFRQKRLPWRFIQFTCGAALAALLFCGFVFSRITPLELFRNLGYMMNDPEHGTPVWQAFPKFLQYTFLSVKGSPVIWGLYAALLGVILKDKERNQHKSLYFMLSLGISSLYVLLFLAFDRLINCLMVPVTMELCFALLLSGKNHKKEWLYLVIPTVCYSVSICASSNQQFHALSALFIITAAYAFVPIWELLRATGFEKRIAAATVCFVLLLFSGCLFLRWKQTAADASTYTMHSVVTQGSCKGLITTEENKVDYDTYYECSQPLREKAAGNILYYSELTWFYLDDCKRSATYSAWMAGMWNRSELPRLRDYYTVNPAKRPDYIFIDRALWGKRDIPTILETLGLSGTYTPSQYGYLITVEK